MNKDLEKFLKSYKPTIDDVNSFKATFLRMEAKFKKARQSLTPTHEDRQRRYDI